MKTLAFKIFSLTIAFAWFGGCGSGKEEKEDKWEHPGDSPQGNGDASGDGNNNNGDGTDNGLNDGDKSGDNGGDNTDGGTDDPDGPVFGLSGTWTTGCGTLKDGRRAMIDYSFHEKTKRWVTTFYLFNRKDRCDELLLEEIDSGTLTMRKNETAGQNGKPMVSFDVHITSRMWRPMDYRIVQQLNDEQFFGYTNWILEQAKETMGRRNPQKDVVKGYSRFFTASVKNGDLYMSVGAKTAEERSFDLDPNPLVRK